MSHDAPPPDCLNCNATLQGPFCHACGQKALAPVVTVHDFVHEATHEFLHFDGKILNTIKLLVLKPGQLTREFIEGRRARYIGPIRVYLTFSLIFFALAAIVPGARESFIKVGPSKGEVLVAEEERQADEMGKAVMHNMPRAAFLLMPVFALLTWLFYRRAQPYYVPHLYVSIHFHAFAFLVLSMAMLLGLLGRGGKLLGSIAFLAVFPYHYIGLRRMFGGSRWKTFGKGTAICVLYWIVLALTMAALAWGTIEGMKS
jgi:hypothetical protein